MMTMMIIIIIATVANKFNIYDKNLRENLKLVIFYKYYVKDDSNIWGWEEADI